MPEKRLILLITADPGTKGAFGGGFGGYARMAQVLIRTCAMDTFRLEACYHSVRQAGRFYRLRFPFRLASDLWAAGRAARRADALHLTLRYRSALPREFSTVGLARLMATPILVDIRAGEFASWYRNASPWARWMMRCTMTWATEITVEGWPDIEFTAVEFSRAATYFPNFVPCGEIPPVVPRKCQKERIHVLFVGYCYDGKGVQELVEACGLAIEAGVPVELTLAGQEEDSFSQWLDRWTEENPRLSIARPGLQAHDEILGFYDRADVFCMPTRHRSEGHSNAINEAMMTGMVIVCTRHGFLESVLSPESCYFVETRNAESIAAALGRIHNDRPAARRKAEEARERLLSNFTDVQVMATLESVYERMVPAKGMGEERK
jgi:glycosyltransferase involved in cell wall biosynthesis